MAQVRLLLVGQPRRDEVREVAVGTQDAQRRVPRVEQRRQLGDDASEQLGLVVDRAADRGGGSVEALERLRFDDDSVANVTGRV
jgi:hypothetical protein